MSEVRMNQKEKRPNKVSKIFIVCNYENVEDAKNKCREDLRALEEFAKTEIGETP